MKSVLISIQPKWCELIASGKKTVEVRKTRPKIDKPFKCYIYCTKQKVNGEILLTYDKKVEGRNRGFRDNGDIPLAGKVIGEFVCYGIEELYQCNSGWVSEYACISQDEFFDYLGIPRGTHLGYDKTAYGWHIDELVIYDKPKELSEFYKRCYSGCEKCKYESWDYDLGGGKDIICTVSNKKPIKRPPQSWCYVEEFAPTKIEHSSLCETDTYEVKE